MYLHGTSSFFIPSGPDVLNAARKTPPIVTHSGRLFIVISTDRKPFLSFRPTGGSGEICQENPADPSASVLPTIFVRLTNPKCPHYPNLPNSSCPLKVQPQVYGHFSGVQQTICHFWPSAYHSPIEGREGYAPECPTQLHTEEQIWY